MYIREPYPNELYHYGVKNQKWGIRRWQNEDGSLTEAGREHYGIGSGNAKREARGYQKLLNDMDKSAVYEIGRYMERDVSQDARTRRSNALYLHGKDEKSAEVAAKALNDREIRDKHAENLRAINSQLNKIMAEAIEKGYDVRSEKVMRSSYIGDKAIMTWLSGGALSTALVSSYGNKYRTMDPKTGREVWQNPENVQGNKFKVKASGNEKGSLRMEVVRPRTAEDKEDPKQYYKEHKLKRA